MSKKDGSFFISAENIQYLKSIPSEIELFERDGMDDFDSHLIIYCNGKGFKITYRDFEYNGDTYFIEIDNEKYKLPSKVTEDVVKFIYEKKRELLTLECIKWGIEI